MILSNDLSLTVEPFHITVEKLGLNPKKDLRHANLEGVNFSNAIICGYDFTGANLINTFGVKITQDASTNFTGASLKGSPFEFDHILRLSKLNRAFAIKLLSLNSNPLEKAVFINKSIGYARVSAEDVIMAKALLRDSESAFELNTGLYALNNFGQHSVDFFQVIRSMLARHYDRESIVATIARILGVQQYNIDEVTNLLLQLLADSRFSVALQAVRSLAKLRPSGQTVNMIAPIIGSEQWCSHRVEIAKNNSSRIGFLTIKPSGKTGNIDEWYPDPLFSYGRNELQYIFPIKQTRINFLRELVDNKKELPKGFLQSINDLPNPLNNSDAAKMLKNYFRATFLENGVEFNFRSDVKQSLRLDSKYILDGDIKLSKTRRIPKIFNSWLAIAANNR